MTRISSSIVLTIALLLLTDRISEVAALRRATWIPSVALPTINQTAINFLHHTLQVTDLYVDVFNQGVAYFNSTTMRSTFGENAVSSVDYLAQIRGMAEIASASAPRIADSSSSSAGPLKVHAWFEYGLMVCYGSVSEASTTKGTDQTKAGNLGAFPGCNGPYAQQARAKGWMFGDGQAIDGFSRLNASNTEVLDFLSGFISDLSQYGGGMVAQLDDHFSCPSSYSRGCSSQVMDNAASYLLKSINRRTGGSVAVSLAPATLSFSQSTLNVDWLKWISDPATYGFTSVVPQLYRSSFSEYQPLFDREFGEVMRSGNVAFLAGIRGQGSAPVPITPWSELSQMITYSEHQFQEKASSDAVGVCIWYSETLLDIYASEFQQLWGGGSHGGGGGGGGSGCCSCVAQGGGTSCSSLCTAKPSACQTCIKYDGGSACAPKCGCYL